MEVPTIDLSNPKSTLIDQISQACSTLGFFEITSHSIPTPLLTSIQTQSKQFFNLPTPTKQSLKRTTNNSRGYFNDEYTKQKLDWKECLDIGMPGGRDWEVDNGECLEGCNQFPEDGELRKVVIEYFKACECLANEIAGYMSTGLLHQSNDGGDDIVERLKEEHTSFLRLNHYPPYDNNEDNEVLGISPHHDAGFLTILLPDTSCHSLQVYNTQTQNWTTITPSSPTSLIVNTGVMAMIYSNGIYQAPLHRVLTSKNERYSIPFFYNPGYRMKIQPFITQNLKYHPCSWGYFRCIRFAGDVMDLGVEIQVEDYECCGGDRSEHLVKQEYFLERVDFSVPFSIEEYRSLLQL